MFRNINVLFGKIALSKIIAAVGTIHHFALGLTLILYL